MFNIRENGNKSDKHDSQEFQVIKAILDQAGITSYEPAVVHHLMYYMNNHITSVLENAQQFSQHANKSNVDESDVSLAIQMCRENELAPISRDINAELASKVNSEPLPEIKLQYGLMLPQEKHCLANINYRLKETPKPKEPTVVQVARPGQQFIPNPQYLAPSDIAQTTVVRKSRLININEQKIVFRPRLKFNIKSADSEYQSSKKQRTN